MDRQQLAQMIAEQSAARGSLDTSIPQGFVAPQELSTYVPSFGERAGDWIGSGMEMLGADPYTATDFGNRAEMLGDVAAGPFSTAYEAGRAIGSGDALGMGIAAVGALPAVGGPARTALAKLARGKGDDLMRVAGTWGDKTRPDVMFEGVSPHEFTPGQWGRFGEAYGAHNIGPLDEDAWYGSLEPFTSKSGQTFHVPGGLESTEPFTYWDDLYMKSQGINPNDLTPEQHLALHNRTVAGKQAPPGGFSDEQINNQFQMALLSPNNPLTPNEFALASTMAKHGDDGADLKAIAEAAPGFDYAKHPMYGPTDEFHQQDSRRELSNLITARLGTQGSEKGGTGVSGNQDYTTLVGLAQMMREKPGFFRFKGAGEGSDIPEEQWLNFVDRIMSQTPGLQGKTGSFGVVWQDPVKAGTSAMDRHMLNEFKEKIFSSDDEKAAWTKKTLDQWNKKNPDKVATTLDEMRSKPGGTGYFNDKIFGYVNRPIEGKMRGAPPRGSNSGEGALSERVPAHLRPENADWVKEPEKFSSLSPEYRRGIGANVESKTASGATGVFSDQWRVWDPIRQRFEPHEITQPGLADVPRMSEKQIADALGVHNEAGYLNYAKDENERLQPVKSVMMKNVQDQRPERQRMARLLNGLDPSSMAYFSMLLGAGAGAFGMGSQEPKGSKEEM